MIRLIRYHLAGFLVTLLCIQAVPTMAEEKPDKIPPKPLKTENSWRGSVLDLELLKSTPVPAYIADAKAFEALWKGWNLGDKVPEVDFKTELVLVTTTRGSGIGLGAMLDDKGDLTTQGIGTADFRPGFRYVIISVKKDGVKSVNGKPLKE